MGRARVWSVVVAAVFLTVTPASADTLVLRDGTKLEGKITIQKPGEYVIIVLANGAQKTVMWESIKEVEVAPPAAAPAPAPAPVPLPEAAPTPAPTDPAPVPTTPPPPAPSPPPPAASASPSLHALGGGGSPVPRAREPQISNATQHGTAQFVLAVPLHIGTAEDFSLVGAGLGLGLRLQVGSAFPNEGRSCNWSGFYVEGLATISYHKTKMDLPNGESADSKDASLQTGGHAGYQFFHVGTVETDEKGAKLQTGYGFTAGLYAGRFSSLGNLASSSMFGPVLGISKNEWDPYKRSLTSLHADLMILPMPTFTLVTFSLTAGFN